MHLRRSMWGLLILGALCGGVAAGQAPAHWVGTWATAPFAIQNSAPQPVPAETLRQIVHVSLGGSAVRVAVSNEYGTASLQVDAASVGAAAGVDAAAGIDAAAGQGAAAGVSTLRAGTLHALTFGGRPSITIPAGAFVLSDPVPMEVAPLSDLAISLSLPTQTIASLTDHPVGLQTNYRVPGDAVMEPILGGAKTFQAYLFLKDVQVLAPADAGAIVAFGDSITDGYLSRPDTNDRWPDELARRLQADPAHKNLAVMNEGLSANRVLHDGAGLSALARIGREGIELPGVKYIVLLEAINDIGNAYQLHDPHDVVSADDLIQAYGQIIARAHEHGIQVIGATLTPFLGAGYSSPAGDKVRMAVNAWIRTPGHFDGVIDFDQITRDPKDPSVYLPAYDHGDHLHPSDAGYKAMGDAVNLDLFRQ